MTLALPIVLSLSIAAAGQWEKVGVPTVANLRGLSVVSAATVWASGTEGTVIRTADGGRHWSLLPVPGAETLDFRGIRAFDDKTAVIISSGPAEKGQARIYRTTDGGASWKQVFEEKRSGIFLDAVAFWDRHHGIVLSDPVDGRFMLFATDNGGATWKQFLASTLPPALPGEGAFAASNSCLTVDAKGNVWFGTGGANVARVFRSSDGGRTWQLAETPMRLANASSGIFSLAFAGGYGIAVGGDNAHPGSSDLPNVMYTTDGGRSWRVAASKTNPAGMYLSSAVHMAGVGIDPGGFVAVGANGAVRLHPIASPEYSGEIELKIELNTVATSADFEQGPIKNLWAVGPKGSVVHKSIVFTGK
jgi:photosystem II stability/assembly factor-like uncharacterized protein